MDRGGPRGFDNGTGSRRPRDHRGRAPWVIRALACSSSDERAGGAGRLPPQAGRGRFAGGRSQGNRSGRGSRMGGAAPADSDSARVRSISDFTTPPHGHGRAVGRVRCAHRAAAAPSGVRSATFDGRVRTGGSGTRPAGVKGAQPLPTSRRHERRKVARSTVLRLWPSRESQQGSGYPGTSRCTSGPSLRPTPTNSRSGVVGVQRPGGARNPGARFLRFGDGAPPSCGS